MKKLILFCFLIIFISSISGLCEEGQIDINSASLEELDNIDHVGPAVAGGIIDARPFNSLNELINVKYISEGYLDDILDQGLACVNGFEEEPEEIVKEEPEDEVVEITEEVIKDFVEEGGEEGWQTQTITPQIIQLNSPKDIKSEENIESLDKTDYVKYGFIGFCILIGVLLILKNKKKSQI